MRQTDFAFENFSFKQEFGSVDFGDKRLNRRYVNVIENIAKNPHSIVQRTQKSWAEMMSAYRMFSNEKVESEEILRVHREQTFVRMRQYDRVLAIQDTSVLCYSSHPQTTGLGNIGMGTHGTKGQGILLHTTMACTTTGTPLGILDQTMWSRGILEPGDELWESERIRWLKGIKVAAGGNVTQVINVTDREGDGSDVFAMAQREKTEFVIRAKEKLRKAASPKGKLVVEVLKQELPSGQLEVTVRAQKIKGEGDSKYRSKVTRKANLNVYYGEVQLRPQGQSFLKPLSTDAERIVRAVLVEEINPPKDFEPVSWLLFTSLKVDSLIDAKEIVDIYKVRWEIEVFHKILKSACKVEKAQLESADRLKRLIVTLSIVAWRLHVLTKLQRENPDLPCTEILTDAEWKALYMVSEKSKLLPPNPPTLREAVLRIAKLGGFIGRKSDGEPGAMTLWLGWQKLIHCTEMYLVMAPT